MHYDLVIRNGSIVTQHGVMRCDVGVRGEKIAAIADDISDGATETIDAAGLHVFPGVIDVHVHFNDPGRADWEGGGTGSAALAAGGGTCFFDMPLNSSPPVLDGETFDAKVAALTGNSYADFALWGGLTPLNLDRMEELAERGVVGFKAFMSNSGIDEFPRADAWTLEAGMAKAATLGLPVAVHAESEELTAGKTAWMRQRGTPLGPMDWPLAREPVAEADAIQQAILLAGEKNCRLHIVHVSNRRCVEIAHHHRGSADVSIETCPHYFMLTAEEVARIGPAAKCAPPIRGGNSPDQLWDAVREGLIDLIGSDHSPAPASMKRGDFWSAWGGIAGVQSTLACLLSRQPQIAPQRVAQLAAATPARRFQIAGKGQIAVGFDADLALVDMACTYELQRENLLDRHKLSPYVGKTFTGVVRRTMLRGKTTFVDGKVLGPPRGRLLKPARSAGG
jgi:allantoinase